jgi:hypothetical protein
MRKNVTPSTNKQDTKNNAPFVFDSFSRGTIQDPPAGEINDCLADSTNLTIYPGFYEGRTGCKLFTNIPFPHIEGRSGYSAHKVGNHVISDSGNIFTMADVGNYWCWGSVYELITDYVDAQTIEVESSDYYSGVSCSVMGALNAFFWHNSIKQWVIQIGTEIYTADWDIPSWQKLLIISRDTPFNSSSDYAEYRDYSFLFNGNGLYKNEIDVSYPIAYRVNLDPPNIRLESTPYFLGATARFKYLYSAARLTRESGIVSRQTPSVIAVETGTNVADIDNIDHNEVYVSNPIDATHPYVLTELYVPIVRNTNPLEYQWHLTHFPIWRTMNLEAKDTNDVNKEKFNDPNRFIWVKDLRMCAAFYGSISGNHFIATRGIFEIDDTHSMLELDNGWRYEILEYISDTTVRLAPDYYDMGSSGPYAAAIGNGRVIRASVSGDILTRTHGSTFTQADLRRTLWNSDGYSLYITEYINANQVRVHNDNGLPVQGFTINPTHRKFYDTISDEMLNARMDFYSCYARYRQALPSANLGVIMPGFVVVAYRGQKNIYYSGLQPKLDYMIGNYVAVQESDEAQDAIQLFWLFQDVLSIICATSTLGIAIGLSEYITLPGSSESIPILPGVKIVSEHTGCLDAGSIRPVENGVVMIITNEPGGEALRQFNGSSYGSDNFLIDPSMGGRIERAIQKTKKISAAIYDGFMGYIFWRKRV